MAYFPFFVDIEGQKCLIAGGGMVAYRKVEVLRDYGPEIIVVSPEMIPEMKAAATEMPDKIHLVHRQFEDSDLTDADFVVAATNDEALNHRISVLCREQKLPVNVVDVQDQCSFIFPALIREKDIVVGISTGGSSPTIAQELKKRFREAIPKGFGELAAELGTYRDMVKSQVKEQSERSIIFKEMVAEGIRLGGVLTREQAQKLITRRLEKQSDTSKVTGKDQK